MICFAEATQDRFLRSFSEEESKELILPSGMSEAESNEPFSQYPIPADMKIIVQRVNRAQVRVSGNVVGNIDRGMLIFVGISKEDATGDADYLAKKVIGLRMFQDKEGKMNCSSSDVGAEILVVSQFTLYGDCHKGRRPSFDKAAGPQKGEELYEYFVDQLRNQNIKVETGQFQAMMDVELVNDGPVTFILESNSSGK